MSGGGSKYFSSDDAKSALEQLKAAEESTQKVKLNAEVAQVIAAELKPFRERDVDVVSRLVHIGEVLRSIVAELVDVRLGGLAIGQQGPNGITDCDFVLVVEDCELTDVDSPVARRSLSEFLLAQFSGSSIGDQDLVFVLRTGGIDVFILVAVSCKGITRIPSEGGWINVNPAAFARRLRTANERLEGKLVDVLKIAKAIIASFPEGQRLTGPHVEIIALEVFSQYDGRMTTKDMLEYFFAQAQHLVVRYLLDENGDRVLVDIYLGDPENRDRNQIANALGRVSRRMKNADAASSTDQWRDIISERL